MTRPITRTLCGKMAEMKMLQLNKNTFFFFERQCRMEVGRDNAMDDMWKSKSEF
jgi:hypothetical protein